MIISHHGINSLSRFSDYVQIGGKKYPFVKIGNQLWLAENLAWEIPGISIGGSGTTYTKAAWYYQNDKNDYGKYGLLYNWSAVRYLSDNSSTLLPDGWKVPYGGDFNTLFNSIGGSGSAGRKLKSKSGWPDGGNGTDDYGFNLKPCGRRSANDQFSGFGSDSALWNASDYGSNGGGIEFSTGSSVGSYTRDKKIGFSLRLFKSV